MATTPITVTDYTTKDIGGEGVFDVMMQAAKAHVVEEYNQGRIKGPEYATVYLGLLNVVMDRAMQFLLEKDKIAAELELIEAQIAKVNAEILKIEKDIEKADADILKTNAEILLINAQKCLADAQFDVAMATIPKVAAEAALLNQKLVTEKAQTSSVGVDPDSVIGKQVALYGAQKDGFIRDAEQKTADALIQSWIVRRTTDEGTLPSYAGLDDANILRAVNKLLAGVGA